MSFDDVLARGEDFLSQYPRDKSWWNYASHATCLFMIGGSKLIMNTLYNPTLHHVEKLDAALARARKENRGLLTVMNHMSVVDDPAFYAALPWRFHWDIDTVRWGFGADNICFSTPRLAYFFNLGKILGTKRFGEGPFQSSIDAAIRVLSPDDTLDLEYTPSSKIPKAVAVQERSKVSKELVNFVKPTPAAQSALASKSPFIRSKTSWFHVFPEGFVLQLEEPHNNSMRYFKWGVTRLILESTRAPVVVPIFTYGFEKVAPEDSAEEGIKRFLPANMGAEIHIHFGDELPDEKIESYREQWRNLCKKYPNKENPNDLSEELKNGKKVQKLRSEVAATLRQAVSDIREKLRVFAPEDPRFKQPEFWKKYTLSEGASNPDVKFIGKNWAVRRFQSHLPEYEEGFE